MLFLALLIAPPYARAMPTAICQSMFRIERPLVYRVTKDGRTTVLLGTIQFGSGLADMPPAIGELVAEATDLGVEQRIRGAWPWPTQAYVAMHVFRRAGPRLSSLLNPAEFQRALDFVGQTDIPAERFDEMSVFGANLVVGVSGLNINPRVQVGQMNRELEARFPMHRVRAYTSALSTARAMRAGMDLDMLKNQIADHTDPRALWGAFAAGDESALAEASARLRRVAPTYHDLLMNQGNAHGAARIEALHRRAARPLVTVDALRLFGPAGLLNQLTRRGFQIEELAL